MKKLVLAYSGGLDTSYCALLLSDEGYEVHAVTVNTGGFSEEEVSQMSEKAYQLGVHKYTCIDAMEEYYQKVIKYLIFGNVLRNSAYPLSVSAERIVQGLAIIDYAIEVDAQAVAHGSTGAGNDQLRFDLLFQTLLPEVEIITPIRDKNLSREEEIAFIISKGLELSWQKAKYSINKGLWGTTVGGDETLTSHLTLPESAYPSQLTKDQGCELTLNFRSGELVGIDGKTGQSSNLIQQLNTLASSYAIGRDIHVGDTVMGIKGRVGFEAAAALIIIKAHHALEKHVLSKWQLQHKDQLANWYGMHLHEGLYLDPVMRNMEAFLSDSQANVSGEVYVSLQPYYFRIEGIKSENDLMAPEFGHYGEKPKWEADEAKGFIKIFGNQSRIYQQITNKA